MSYSAGKLRHRIDIQHRVKTRDPDTGEVFEDWADLHTSIPAAIEPLSVKEFLAAQQVQSEVTTRIVIRYRDGLDATMRIIHNGKVYAPQGWLPDPDSGLEYLTAPCSEGKNEGQ